ncbi:MAG: alpha-L-fucosidase [Bryobacteraceae bacterium]
MKRALLVLCTGMALLRGQQFADVRPSPQQLAWQDLEIGVLIHFGPNTWMDREWGDGKADPAVFNPAQFDPEQWVRAAQAAGAKYLVLVAKHHDGFCLFPTRETKYGVASSPWRDGKGDMVREVAAACRKHGLRFGVYLSPWDRHEPAYKDNAAYDTHYAHQVEELASRYGELTEFWLDGAGSEGHVYDFTRYIRTLRTYQPNTMIFADVGLLPNADIRWVGNEDGTANEENWNVVDAYQILRWRPAEADTPLRDGHWFWHPNAEGKLKPLDKLMEIYHQTVGRGAQLVLGLAPDNRGLLPEVDVKRLAEFGAEVRRIYGRGLLEQRSLVPTNPELCATAPEHACSYEVRLSRNITFDRAVIEEDLTEGQRIREYWISTGVADTGRLLAHGTTVGHKKIEIFAPATASKVYLTIASALGPPRLRSFNVYLGTK